jgi:transposase
MAADTSVKGRFLKLRGEMATRKKYTKELKQDAVRLVTEQGYKHSEAARNLGIDHGMLARWVKEFQEEKSEAFRGNGKPTSEGEEPRRLREENRCLKMEQDILKSGPGRGGCTSRWL